MKNLEDYYRIVFRSLQHTNKQQITPFSYPKILYKKQIIFFKKKLAI